MMRYLQIITFGLMCVAQIAAAGELDCDARLSGDRYYGAFHVQFQSGKLKREHLLEALKSELPYDPYKYTTPFAAQSSPKRFFEQLVRADAPAGHSRTKLPKLRLEQRVQTSHRQVAQVLARARGRDAGTRAIGCGGTLGRF